MKGLTFEEALKSRVSCEVRFDTGTKGVYSTDASNYRHIPLGVVFPRSAEEIVAIVTVCREYDVPVISRGGGTSLAGQGCNEALMIETSKYYNQIIEINPTEKTALIQPGIVLDTLREEAKKHGLTFGPDPATHNRCTLGGMMGNNSCGVHSVMAGRTVDNVIELDVLTYDGTRMKVGPTSPEEYEKIMHEGGRKAEIYSRLKSLMLNYQKKVREKYPNIPRRVSGYNLDDLLPENGFDVARALIGSEGTCVIILEAKLKLVPEPPKHGLVVAGYRDIYAAAAACPALIKHHPIGLEAADYELIEHMKTKHLQEETVHNLPGGMAWLFIEAGADNKTELELKLHEFAKVARHTDGFQDLKILTDHDEQKKYWEVRETGLGATAFVPGEEDTWEGWEDSAVEPKYLPEYLRALKELYNKYHYRGVFYGHFGQGCVHTRINFDLVTMAGIQKYRAFIHDAAKLVVRYNGSISGEHGDGQSKAELLPLMFGPELIQAFTLFKSIWDPLNKMNPGRIVHAVTPVRGLRLGTHYHPNEPDTHFKFPEDGGSFARASLRCVGVGLCRQKEGGVMCPSYQVTHEEKHTTRGRARLLFEMMNGKLIEDGWKSEAVKESLDLCLACKGCKGECPVNVDMATYKAEFLSHYYQRRLRPREAYAMGQIQVFARFASLMPRLVNWVLSIRWISRLFKWLGGIHPQRELPQFALRPFDRRQHDSSLASPASTSKQVLLWVDTFSNHFHPDVAESAISVLKSAGFDVILPEKRFCCGRPLYDYGFLKQARGYLNKILDAFGPMIQQGIPIIHLEPSCASVFTEELIQFFPNDLNAKRMKAQTFMLSDFLLKRAPDFVWPAVGGRILVQGHCHHRSVLHFNSEVELLKKIGFECHSVNDGCCGMAGSFGFSKEHYDISVAIAEHGFMKKLREAPAETPILANGFSCRTQLQQTAGVRAYHIAEVLDLILKGEWKWNRSGSYAGLSLKDTSQKEVTVPLRK